MDILNLTRPDLQQIATIDLFARFLVSFLLSLLSGIVYSKNRISGEASKQLIASGIGLSLIVTMILVVLSENLFYALGLFAALSIIRFRTPIKSSMDTIYLFLAIAIGIGTGANALKIVILGTFFILSIQHLYLFVSHRYRIETYLLKVFLEEDTSLEAIEKIVQDKSRHAKVAQIHSFSNSGKECLFTLQLRPGTNIDQLTSNIVSQAGIKEALLFQALPGTSLL